MFAEFNRTKVTWIDIFIHTYTGEANIKRVKMNKVLYNNNNNKNNNLLNISKRFGANFLFTCEKLENNLLY